MSLKKRILSFFTAFLMIFGSTPFVFENASAAENSHEGALNADGEAFKPDASKKLDSNGDGTYTITLSVTGKAQSTTTTTKANALVVFDTSGSMGDRECLRYTGTGWGRRCAEYSTRLQVAKDAVNSLAEDLLSNNTEANPDMVELAFIDFSSNVNDKTSIITSYDTGSNNDAKNWINGRGATGGTNWEAALKAANEFSFDDEDQTYIIFVSDGNPTFRLTSHEATDDQRVWIGNSWNGHYETTDTDEFYYPSYSGGNDTLHDSRRHTDGTYGTGVGDHYGWNLSDAKTQATAITTAGKKFYAVGTFGDADNMNELGGEYYDATDSEKLNAAFSKIASQITNSLNLKDVEFDDGITTMTQVASSMVDGEPTGFTYTLNGNTVDKIGTVSLDNNNVAWEVGDLGNGDVATLSFIVWPKQEAYDLIADLDNGVKNYDDLTDDEKYQIEKTADGHYNLKTNTESPKLYYKTIETIDGVPGELSAEKYITIENPDPVPVNDLKVPLMKLWNDSLDNTQRLDKNNPIKEITLELTKTDVETDTTQTVAIKHDGETISEFKLTKDSTVDEQVSFEGESYDAWVYEHEIAIAPGEMISNSSDNYELLKGTGKFKEIDNYLILDEGYDYKFNEISGDYHFELENIIYHPMIIDGELKSVVIERDSSGKITELKIEDSVAIYAMNTLKGGINVSKVVYKNDSDKPYETNESFKVKITLEKDGEPYNYDYKVYTYSNVEHTGEANVSGHICSTGNENDNCGEVTNQSGIIEAEITPYDVIRVINVESGVKYKVEELDANSKLGYSPKTINYFLNDEEVEGENGFYTVFGNTASNAVVVNNYYTGALKISKTVTVESGNEKAAKAKTFNFTATIKDGEKTIKTETCELKHGESCEIKDLPAGATYEVSETEVEGFTMSSENETGTIEKEEEGEEPKTAAFTNTYKLSGSEATITVKKDFGNFWHTDLESGLADTFIFILKDSKGEVIGRKEVTETLKDSVKFIVPIEINEKIDENGKTFNFTITEDENFTRDGISRVENDEDIEVAIVAKDDGKGGITFEEAELSKDTIYNTYEATGSLTLQAKKVLEGREWLDSDKFSFELKNEDGETLDTAEVSMNDVEDEVADFSFEELEFTEADAGKTYTYTISETGTLPAGVENTTGDITVTVEISDNYDGTLTVTAEYSEENQTFINEYSTKATDAEDFVVKVSKEIVDDSEDQTVEDTEFAFIIKGLCEEFEDYSETIYITTEDLIGSGAFSGISFDEVGEYQFEVSEVNDEKEYFEYDTSTYVVTVVVEDDYETAQLYIASKTVDEEEKEEIDLDFENHYNEPGRGEVEEPEETETNPYTRDNISLFISLYIISLIGFIGAIVYAKKRI